MLSNNEFNALDALRREGGLSQRALADVMGCSLGLTNSVMRELVARGLVDGGNCITPRGREALEPYRVKNAIIMAAGLSSRFAPISYERPKGVLRVRGEILIERQIEQLMEAGITDITLVLGYKKEEFFYLEDKYGVSIVMNDAYASRNNNSTIYKVRHLLGNTYICSSDDYFTENPFEQYVYCAYYSAVYEVGETSEYCLFTKGREERIVDVKVGGENAWVMMGHAYWSRDFSARFVAILERIYHEPATAPKLWEDIYIEHLSELPMVMRRYPHDVIWEFDSLDELREFDPQFIENVDSNILDNICSVLSCERTEIHSIIPIKQGLTNLSFRFSVGDSVYVYRHPGPGTDEIINRASETFSQGVARELGIDDTFIYEDERTGWKISRFVSDCVPFDYHDAGHVEQALAIARKLHGCGRKSAWSFDVYRKAQGIVEMLAERDLVGFADFERLSSMASQLYDAISQEQVPQCLCHNDFYAPNFLVSGDSMSLIDWEYSAMGDYASDLGTFICCSDYTVDEAKTVIDGYFGGSGASEAQMRHCLSYVALCAYYWFVWALYKEKTNDPVGEWLYMWYRATKTFGEYVLESRERS